MRYRSDKSKTAKKYISIALGVIVCALFIYFWQQFRSFVYPVIEPVAQTYGGSKFFAGLVPDSIKTYMLSRKALADTNATLLREVERLENVVAERDAMLRELSLSSLSISGSGMQPVVVYPIAEDVTKIYSTILLSKGYSSGIKDGALVHVRGRQVVCQIVEVGQKTSLCELLSKGGRVTEGVAASSSLTLNLVGAGGGSFVAEAPKSAPITIGESVYLRSEQSYILGVVIAIKEEEQSTGAKVYVRGAYNPISSSVFYVEP